MLKLFIRFLFYSIVFAWTTNSNASINYYKDWNNFALDYSGVQTTGHTIFRSPDENIWYISISGYVAKYYWDASSGSWVNQEITVAAKPDPSGSQFSYGDGKLFYVGTDRKVYYLYYDAATGWNNGVLNSSATLAGGDIGVQFVGNSTIYYANAYGSITCDMWNGSSWVSTDLTSYLPLYGAQLSSDYNGKLFYTGRYNQVYNLYYDGSSWQNYLISSSASLAGSGPIYAKDVQKLYYIDQNGYFANLLWNSSSGSWDYFSIPELGKQSPLTPFACTDDGDIYFINYNDKKMHMARWEECKWGDRIINNTKVVSSSTSYPDPIACSKDKVYYSDRDLSQVSNMYPDDFSTDQFIYLKGRHFVDGSNNYVPMVMNYRVDIMTTDQNDLTKFWIIPQHGYVVGNQICSLTSSPYGGNQAMAAAEMLSDFQQIKSMGFNAIRLIGTSLSTDNTNNLTFDGILYQPGPWVPFTMDATISTNRNMLFDKINIVVQQAKAAGLKVILLSGAGCLQHDLVYPKYSTFLTSEGNYFQSETGIFAYDLMNEPSAWSNCQSINESKDQICERVTDWYNAVRVYDNNHLITMGLQGRSDVPTFDPSIMKIDFISFHIYPYDNPHTNFDQVASEMKWISDNIMKPWIIGETGFWADYSSSTWGTYTDQENYAAQSLQRTFGCGGLGYSWWDYVDSDSGFGMTEKRSSCSSMLHPEKPSATVMSNFNTTSLPACDCPMPNPANYYGTDKFPTSGTYVSGVVVDNNGNPITNAIVQGKTSDGSEFYQVPVYPNGSWIFRIKSPSYTVVVSALGMQTQTFTGTPPSPLTLYPINCNNQDYNAAPKVLTSIHAVKNDNTSEAVASFKVYPNPNSGKFNLEISKLSSVNIIDITGKSVYKNTSLAPGVNILDLSYLDKGIYIIQLIQADGKFENKIVIQ